MNSYHAQAIHTALFAIALLLLAGQMGATGFDAVLRGGCYLASFGFLFISVHEIDKAASNE